MAKLLSLVYKRLSNTCLSLQNSTYLKKCMYVSRIAIKYGMKIVGPMFVTLCTCFVSFIIATYFYVVYPLLDAAFAYFNVGVAVVLGYNLFFNYVMCVTTPPGCPPICQNPSNNLGVTTVGDVEEGSKGHETRYILDVAPAVVYKYCRVCKVIKPPRTHHCSVSDRCVLNMDHFCPWMNNAIGYYNYRYFYLFLFYILFGALYAAIVFSVCYNKDTYELRSVKHYWTRYSFLSMVVSNEELLLYAVALCASAVLSVGGLLAWHTYLLATNQTTIEYYVNFEESEHCKELDLPFKNPFDRGWRRNIMRLAANPDLISYSNSSWPAWLNWLNWFRLITYNMIGPLKYIPPESEFSFVIDDSNRDQLFQMAIEYNHKLLNASRRRYQLSPYDSSSSNSSNCSTGSKSNNNSNSNVNGYYGDNENNSKLEGNSSQLESFEAVESNCVGASHHQIKYESVS